jgi:hypothetical protein
MAKSRGSVLLGLLVALVVLGGLGAVFSWLLSSGSSSKSTGESTGADTLAGQAGAAAAELVDAFSGFTEWAFGESEDGENPWWDPLGLYESAFETGRELAGSSSGDTPSCGVDWNGDPICEN